MKFANAPAERRPYRQTARAEAAEATGRRILDAFVDALREDWLDDITLERVARTAGVTVQTVIRRYGGKDGLLEAIREPMTSRVLIARGHPVGELDQAVASICADYEQTGDMLIRLLADEARFPALHPLLDHGRAWHRGWVDAVARPWLTGLAEDERQHAVDALVTALDVYVWKLLRRDLDRPRNEVADVMRRLVDGVLSGLRADDRGRKPR